MRLLPSGEVSCRARQGRCEDTRTHSMQQLLHPWVRSLQASPSSDQGVILSPHLETCFPNTRTWQLLLLSKAAKHCAAKLRKQGGSFKLQRIVKSSMSVRPPAELSSVGVAANFSLDFCPTLISWHLYIFRKSQTNYGRKTQWKIFHQSCFRKKSCSLNPVTPSLITKLH